MPRFCVPFALPSAAYLLRRECLQPTPRGVGRLEGHYIRGTRRLSTSPLIPLTRTRCASLLLTIRFAECRIPSERRGPSTKTSRRGTSRGSRALKYAPPLLLSPASPPPHHTAMASLLSPSSSPIGSLPPLSHTLSSSPPSDSNRSHRVPTTNRRARKRDRASVELTPQGMQDTNDIRLATA